MTNDRYKPLPKPAPVKRPPRTIMQEFGDVVLAPVKAVVTGVCVVAVVAGMLIFKSENEEGPKP